MMERLSNPVILLGGAAVAVGCMISVLCVAVIFSAANIIGPPQREPVVAIAQTATRVAQNPPPPPNNAKPPRAHPPPGNQLPFFDAPTAVPFNPGGNTGGNISNNTADAAPVGIVQGNPADTVADYYRAITARSYDRTWATLSDDFKQKFNCCAPNYNFNGYLDWWNSVSRVDVGAVRVISQSGNRAVVYADLTYVMNDGGSFRDNAPYFELVFRDGRWFFDDKRETA